MKRVVSLVIAMVLVLSALPLQRTRALDTIKWLDKTSVSVSINGTTGNVVKVPFWGISKQAVTLNVTYKGKTAATNTSGTYRYEIGDVEVFTPKGGYEELTDYPYAHCIASKDGTKMYAYSNTCCIQRGKQRVVARIDIYSASSNKYIGSYNYTFYVQSVLNKKKPVIHTMALTYTKSTKTFALKISNDSYYSIKFAKGRSLKMDYTGTKYDVVAKATAAATIKPGATKTVYFKVASGTYKGALTGYKFSTIINWHGANRSIRFSSQRHEGDDYFSADWKTGTKWVPICDESNLMDWN